MKDEYDFSKAERGKFFHPEATFHFPVYLEADVDDFLTKLADEKGMAVEALVNEWLRVNIRLIQEYAPH